MLCLVRRHCCGILHSCPWRGIFHGGLWEKPQGGGKGSNSINDHMLPSLPNSTKLLRGSVHVYKCWSLLHLFLFNQFGGTNVTTCQKLRALLSAGSYLTSSCLLQPELLSKSIDPRALPLHKSLQGLRSLILRMDIVILVKPKFLQELEEIFIKSLASS